MGRTIHRRYQLLGWCAVLCGLLSSTTWAASSPTKTVQLFLEAHRRGRFAEARGFTLEQANLHASLFSNWLFVGGGSQQGAATADIFLSRKFTDAFRYTITGATPGGENQAYVNVIRTSPNIMHMYTWALAPRRGAPPYALIESVDAYLTKVNFPVEESRMQFTLIREAGEWYISAARDEKFAQLQQQVLAQPVPTSAVASAPASQTTAVAPATTTSEDRGRLLSDAQFNATLQSVNAVPPPAPVGSAAAEPPKKKKESFFAKLFGGGRKKGTSVLVDITNERLSDTFYTIRDALAMYTESNDEFPDSTQIYNWKTLRRVVNRYSKVDLPPTEEEAGFRFIQYDVIDSAQDYILLVELQKPQNGIKRVEVTPLGIDRVQ